MMDGFKKKKKYGQNFLTNPMIPKRIVAESGVCEGYGVLEIGAGQGILTSALAEKATSVVALEIDGELMDYLNDKFRDTPNVRVINGDIMKFDVEKLINESFQGLKTAVVANLPYYITSPVIMKLLEGRYGFESMTFMVQKEVANRLAAGKGTPEYGAISAVCAYYASVKKLFAVPAGAFSPPPKVDSAVIKFGMYHEPPVAVEDEKLFFELIKAGFAQRRKMFSNSIQSCLNNLFTKQEICGILFEVGLDVNVRGEDLGIADYARITNELSKLK